MSSFTPLSLLTQLGLVNVGATVADLGSGIGTWGLPLARLVGPAGQVYVVEIQKELLETVAAKARESGLSNISYIWGDIETRGGTKIADGILDVVVVANVLFQSSAAYSIALEIKRILKPNGKVLVVEWKDSFNGIGPVPDMVVAPETLVKIFSEAGFGKVKDVAVGDYHYGIIFRKESKTLHE